MGNAYNRSYGKFICFADLKTIQLLENENYMGENYGNYEIAFTVNKFPSSKDLYPCSKCQMTFSSLEYLQEHLQTHEIAIFGCQHCGKSYGSNQYLQEHIQTMHSSDSMECDFCQARFKSKKGLLGHLLKCHEEKCKKKMKCVMCRIQFSSVQQYSDHMFCHKSQNLCRKCDKTFLNADSLKQHLLICGKKEKKYECSICFRKFIAKRYVSDHMNYHHRKKGSALCSTCGKQMSSKTALDRHLKEMHGVEEVKEKDILEAIHQQVILQIEDTDNLE